MSEKKKWQASVRMDGIFTFESEIDFDGLAQDEADDIIADIFWTERGEDRLDFEVEDFWPINTTPSKEEKK